MASKFLTQDNIAVARYLWDEFPGYQDEKPWDKDAPYSFVLRPPIMAAVNGTTDIVVYIHESGVSCEEWEHMPFPVHVFDYFNQHEPKGTRIQLISKQTDGFATISLPGAGYFKSLNHPIENGNYLIPKQSFTTRKYDG